MTEKLRPEALYPKTHFSKLENFEPGAAVVGKAIRYESFFKQIVVDFGGGFTGIIPENEVCITDFKYPISSEIPYQISTLIGKQVRAIVTGISDNDIIILSRKHSMMEAWNSIEEGMILEATITNITSHGIFIDIGNGFISYVNIRNCSVTRYNDIHNWFKIGDIIRVKITQKDYNSNRLSASRKDAYPNIWENILIQRNDVIIVKASSNTTAGGYFCEYTPAISGILDILDGDILHEGQEITVRVKKIKDKGLKVSRIK